MEVLREVNGFKLNKGDGMARGLFNISNEEILNNSETEGVSLWFNNDTKDECMNMNDEEFIEFAETSVKSE